MKIFSTQKGSVLVFAMIVLSMLLVSAITVITVSVIEKRSSFATQKSVLAFQAADSGAERVLKRIYLNNSPTLAACALNACTFTDSNLNALATSLTVNTTSPSCNAAGRYITGTNDQVVPAYTFQVTFYDNTTACSGQPCAVACNDPQWRDKAIKIKSTGFFQGTSRVIEIGIRPRT